MGSFSTIHLEPNRRCPQFHSQRTNWVAMKTPLCGKVKDVKPFWNGDVSLEACIKEECLEKCAQEFARIAVDEDYDGPGCCQFIARGSKHRFEKNIPDTCWLIQGSGGPLKQLRKRRFDYSYALVMPRPLAPTPILTPVFTPQGFDEKLRTRACLPHLIDWEVTNEDEICREDSEYKDDRGNYIKYTRKEDAIARSIWLHVMNDCKKGLPYLRNIVSAFAEAASCFKYDDHGQPAKDKNGKYILEQNESWRVPYLRVSSNGYDVEPDEANGWVKNKSALCEGADGFGPEEMTHYQTQLRNLTQRYDELSAKVDKTSFDVQDLGGVCRDLHAAHYLKRFNVRELLDSTRAHVCSKQAFESSNDGSQQLCNDLEDWYLKFRHRSLFASHSVKNEATNETLYGKKGKASKAENKRAHYCLKEAGLTSKTFWSQNVGISVDRKPKCTIPEAAQDNILPEASPKPNNYMSSETIADYYRSCAVPFVAGLSGTVLQYIMFVGGGKEKVGKQFKDALSDKELLTIMSMLELAGFHSIAEQIMAVNHYYANADRGCANGFKGIVRPPFDSGDLLQNDFAKNIRCHSEACCGPNPSISERGLLANDSPYMEFITSFEEWVNRVFVGSGAPRCAPTHVAAATPTSNPTNLRR